MCGFVFELEVCASSGPVRACVLRFVCRIPVTDTPLAPPAGAGPPAGVGRRRYRLTPQAHLPHRTRAEMRCAARKNTNMAQTSHHVKLRRVFSALQLLRQGRARSPAKSVTAVLGLPPAPRMISADFIEKMYFTLLNKSLAAPAVRRLGRAGLEALPLRARNFFDICDPENAQIPCTMSISH